MSKSFLLKDQSVVCVSVLWVVRVGSGADQKSRQLESCSGVHAYLGWLCQCFSIFLSLTLFFWWQRFLFEWVFKREGRLRARARGCSQTNGEHMSLGMATSINNFLFLSSSLFSLFLKICLSLPSFQHGFIDCIFIFHLFPSPQHDFFGFHGNKGS
jgi:hypothetical protein